MAKKKPKQEQVTTLKNWEEVDQLLKAIATIESKKMQEESKLNEKILKAQQDHEPTLNKLNADKLGYETDINLFCETRKDEFVNSRSMNLNYGVVGFRKGSGALKPMKGYTWESIKNVIEKSKKFAERFIKIKKDLNKEAILAAQLKASDLAKYGLHVVQEDAFYYEAYLKQSSEEAVR